MGASFKISDLFSLDTLFPPAPDCLFCRQAITLGGAGRLGLCRRCLRAIETSRMGLARCNRCGKYVQAEGRCVDCRLREPCFLQAWSIGPYEGLLRQCVHDLKYQGFRGVARPLGRLMAERLWDHVPGNSWHSAWGELKAAVLTPIPLHPEKLYRRNFNQAQLLAEAVADATGFPVADLLGRREDRTAQARLSRQERLRNLRGQFFVQAPPEGDERQENPLKSSLLASPSAVILVDDVYTTGATVQEAAQTLQQWGVRQVYALTAAAGMGV
ncbi:hypothetical protein GTO89_08420 [Heliobacterium gestii]|uniref:Double zinc ribbon domain-containing protein n=1 Tax=Heliomicrobium gestii TaxID=2699 RepID=A0A845LEK6_HELGE|nr:ComF family protein [Heliomicrobium gestii]MBM7866661.1 ComF family protein [Heliomicrobium gestii]MZP43059.1 hypothetical protein [Heliomicrobium gestii]